MNPIFTHLIAFVLGVVVLVIYNIVRPEKVDKASRELSEEFAKHGFQVAERLESPVRRAEVAADRLQRVASDLTERLKAAGDLVEAVKRLKG